ncbi:MAG: argininosuccinate lyase [Proteobacteria bacterium]|nr:MAG: argininosuccinate lyase [Pseudomonadota bacterium]
MSKLWGGRFAKDTHQLVDEYCSSLAIDTRLALQDIEGSLAHAEMLGKTGILPQADVELIITALGEISTQVRLGKVTWDPTAEDVHSEIERLLREKCGPIAGKLHTARSRNDQVLTDTKLYLKSAGSELLSELKETKASLVAIAEKNINTILPGLTHTQHAQPVSLSHHFLAYFWMFDRDVGRLTDLLKRADECPLGAAALAGTSFPIDRHQTAAKLGFAKPTENSLDTVSDRDFLIEFLSFSSILMMHLSRIAEELVWWSTPEFNYVTLDDSVTTGSSIMPQKKNPDVAELIRGKVGRVYGSLMGALTMMKALPLSYNRDLQEDKQYLFEAVDLSMSSLRVMRLMLDTAVFNGAKMEESLAGDFSNATDLADDLVKKGLPFRDAHEVVGKVVRFCLETGKKMEALSLDELKSFSALFDQVTLSVLPHQAVMEARTSFGATGSKQVKTQIERAKAVL